MHSEIINLSHGYTAKICQDVHAENPWTEWDGQPPIMVFSERRIEEYGTGLSIREIFLKVPLSAMGDNAEHVLKALEIDGQDLAEHLPYGAPLPSTLREWHDSICEFLLPDSPSGWREAIEYFDKCESLCDLAGIPCLNEQSNGYCQGDSSRVFIAALPAWAEEVGWQPEDPAAALRGDLKTWSAWAWGDVYGISAIFRPDGEEMDDGITWGFYDSNHKESGLLESAEDSVVADIRYLAKESAERERAACADIMTV